MLVIFQQAAELGLLPRASPYLVLRLWSKASQCSSVSSHVFSSCYFLFEFTVTCLDVSVWKAKMTFVVGLERELETSEIVPYNIPQPVVTEEILSNY